MAPPDPSTEGRWYPAPGFATPPPRRSRTKVVVVGAIVTCVVAGAVCAGILLLAADPVRVAPPQPARRDLPPEPPPGFRTIDGIGYSYAVPSAWEELEAGSLGSPLVSHAQRAPIPVGNFATNVNVAEHAYVGDGPAFAAANLAGLRAVATIRDQRPATSGSRPAWDVEAHWPSADGIAHVTLQRYAGNGATAFVLTCSAGASAFESERPLCESILATFRVE